MIGEINLFLLNRLDFERVRSLFRKMDMHLPLQAILAGNVIAPIYVDNPINPQVAMTWTGHRIYLAGTPGNTELIRAARKIFLENFSMSAWNEGIDSYFLGYPTPKWEPFVQSMLQQKYPIKNNRLYFSRSAGREEPVNLPEGFSISFVDRDFLAKSWSNLDYLTDEMVSERVSVEDFLDKSFGVCLTNNDLIVGWCLSEYNTGHRCEIGISVHPDFRLRGFAVLLTKAFINQARTLEYAKFGWHCHAGNVGSAATALKAGFEKISDYPVYMGWFDDVINIANNGYFAHGRGEFTEALDFYEKAFSLGDAPDWAFWGAACDAAMIGEVDKAFKYLDMAIDHGFDDPDQIMGSKYLQNLHDKEGWSVILKRVQ
jgi:RimJ/RimL family protein N-acetyltransferase